MQSKAGVSKGTHKACPYGELWREGRRYEGIYKGHLKFMEGPPNYAFCIQYGYHMATHQEIDQAGETLFLRPGQRLATPSDQFTRG